MRPATVHIIQIISKAMVLALLPTILTGCQLEDDRDMCCPGPLTMHYVYRPDGTDVFSDNILSLRHFLFDAGGIFVRELPPGEKLNRQPLELNAGTYTMITIGNMTDITSHDHGSSHLIDQFTLSHTARNRKRESAYANTDELFWGVKHFAVDADGRGHDIVKEGEALSTNRLTTPMVNIHCHLKVTVEWVGRPPYIGSYEMELAGVHTQYSLDPGNASLTADGLNVPAGDKAETYSLNVPLRQLGLREEFVTLRYTDTQIPTLRIKYDGHPVVPDIDLGKAFRTWGWRPSATHVQDYEILLRVINENRVDLLPMVEGSVADWVNGGSFG